MTLIITVVHILVSLSLIFIVLLQKGSGADMGAAFGGSSQSVFGARGSGSFLGKVTAGLATVFMITSLSLAFVTSQRGANVSVMEKSALSDSGGSTATTPALPPSPVKESAQPAEPPVQPPPTPAKAEEPAGTSAIPALPVAKQGQESDFPSVPKSNP
ncbi:MAG: preprotein translocase subunit SecG [Magnetococcales bacterium]|nr:preprotein translocase subunit SecG [Magnetococcales bacterium]